MMDAGESGVQPFPRFRVRLQQGEKVGNAVAPGGVEDRFRVVDQQSPVPVERVQGVQAVLSAEDNAETEDPDPEDRPITVPEKG